MIGPARLGQSNELVNNNRHKETEVRYEVLTLNLKTKPTLTLKHEAQLRLGLSYFLEGHDGTSNCALPSGSFIRGYQEP